MRAIELPWEAWRAVIAVLREKGLPHMLEHADLNDDLFLRSYDWARWQLGMPLPGGMSAEHRTRSGAGVVMPATIARRADR